MRKIDEIAQQKFGGDSMKAVEYLLYNSGATKFDEYVDELTQQEAAFVMSLLEHEAVKYYGSKKAYQAEIDKNTILEELNLTEEEVRNAPKNPYKANILKSVFKMLVMEGGVIALSIFGKEIGIDPQVIGIANSVVTGLLSMMVADNLSDYFKFKKAKKTITNFDNKHLDDNQSRGRVI